MAIGSDARVPLNTLFGYASIANEPLKTLPDSEAVRNALTIVVNRRRWTRVNEASAGPVITGVVRTLRRMLKQPELWTNTPIKTYNKQFQGIVKDTIRRKIEAMPEMDNRY
jgi:hypothetical protein